ncbi:hypothetical protein GCM10011367_18990 [Marinicauda pacifica]|uniref:YaiO family outer membrane beta-barrel protein n=1 Tax=Marinicauda pacifica TaxID=1133559 RepID=A0A4S2HBF2_9PROT|nr:YaiO family outer membrane beta-barrel protein [Marinicauda pacifica]TGY93290.1 YaiO family outer membrane beta-barrel protein [Marinicauda pacifica]GGE44466.1 hypothetical protein GCM10011367_18990 [Marinicauda pacifica]
MTISGFLLSAALVLQAPTYETGVDARLDGRFEEAAEILAEVAQREPANADVFLQLGLTLSALGRFDEAEAALQRTLDLAPDYTDAHIALARLAYYRGDLDRAAELAAALPDDQTPPDLRARIDAARESPARSPWRTDVFAAYSSLSGPLSPWREAGVALGRRIDEETSLTGLAHWSRRFDDEDVYLSLTYARGLPDSGLAYVTLGGAPQADFRAQAAIRGGYESPTAPGGDGVQATVEASASRYGVGDVFAVQPGVRYLARSDGLRLGLRAMIYLDETRALQTGWEVSGELRASDRARLIASYTDAPDTESGRTSEVQSAALGLRYQLTDRLGLQAGLVHESREAYDRTEITISANRRF